MKKNFLLFLLLTYFSSDVANADNFIMPPEVSMIDKNNVDILTSSATLTVKRGAIGSGIGELSFSDSWDNPVLLDNNFFDILQLYYSGKGMIKTVTASFQGSSLTFRKSIDSWGQIRGNNANLTESSDSSVMTVVMKDGEARVYNRLSTQGSPIFYLLDHRLTPEGVYWKYNWQSGDVARVTSVTNNLGYKLEFRYQTDDTNDGFGWHFIKEVDFYNLSRSTSPIYAASGSYSTSGSNSIIHIVTSSGEVWETSGQFYPNPFVQTSSTFYVKTPSSSSFNKIYHPLVLLPLGNSQSTTANINGLIYKYQFNWGSSYKGEADVTAPNGSVKKIKFFRPDNAVVSTGYPISIEDELGRVTSYSVNGYLNITNIIKPELDQENYTYDDRGNLTAFKKIIKPGKNTSGASNPPIDPSSCQNMVSCITKSANYKTSCDNIITCNKPYSTTDENGNVTLYIYDPVHGGVLTETSSLVNSVARVKRTGYVQRNAWILSSSGAYIKLFPAVWLKNEERVCMTTATAGSSCAGGAADESVTTYDYGPDSGPNNLLLRGVAVSSNGKVIRTCYTYDSAGNRISETKPLGAGSTCP